MIKNNKKILLLIAALTVLSCIFSFNSFAVSKPGKVTGLEAEAHTKKVVLSWNEVRNCDAYAVFYYKPSSKSYEFIKNVSDTECSVKNLKEGTDYYFAVQGYNKTDDGKLYGTVSEYVKATTEVDAPDKVTSLDTSAVYSTKLKLTWDEVKGAKYAVYFYNTKTKKYKHIDNTSKEYLVVKDLDPETTYRFAVRAYRKLDGETYYGPFSSKLKVTTKTYPIDEKDAKNLFEDAMDIYMKWVYSCEYTASSGHIYRNFYGRLCSFAPVNHPDIKTKKDLKELLSKYLDESLYENELYLYIESGDKLYYYAEGGSGDPDTNTKYYTVKLKKVSDKKYRYVLYPVYYTERENDTRPESYTFTIVRRNGKWIFDGKFYACTAKIKDD